MLEKRILLRFGDLVLKGKNKPAFVKQVRRLLKEKMNGLGVVFDFQHDRTYMSLTQDNDEQVLKHLSYVSGLQSYSYVYKTTKDIDDILALAIKLVQKEIPGHTTFKVETKRADKTYPFTSLELTRKLAPMILKSVPNLTVDVRKPEHTLNIEVRLDGTYLFLRQYPAMGGYPVGIGGRGLVMLSGGIDSPVSAYLAMKQGIAIELFHFESTPMTPLESVQKVIDLAKKLSHYMPDSKIKLHLVPFRQAHQEILEKVNDSYLITIMRRLMYRMGEKFARNHDILCLINGESVGQVASQTLSSMNVVENVTRIPILRPVVTYDKQDIINISKRIDTFDISIRAFNDCCSIYVPKRPVTQPTLLECEKQERLIDVDVLVENALEHIETLVITPETNLEINQYGFEVKAAIETYRKKD